MAIEPVKAAFLCHDDEALNRRQWLKGALLASASPVLFSQQAQAASHTHQTRLAAAWQVDGSYQIGLLAQQDGAAFEISAAFEVPTRAHGVWPEKGGTLLAVARRPGDWLLRWSPTGAADWAWVEPDRAFNGHVISSPDGKTLYTTETHLETGQGLIGLRRADSLEKLAEWPTHGMDPHELLLDRDGSLIVANGGIAALPETGRLKLNLERMDSSLVRLDTRCGQLLGQWRLPDQRLSLRHIAWGPTQPSASGGQRTLGIALQAEHDDPASKTAAPVLALFDGQTLRTVTADAGQSLRGYGGDISFAAGFFAVSCPRANGVALWQPNGQWAGFRKLDEACALTAVVNGKNDTSVLWAAGNPAALALDGQGQASAYKLQTLRLDNHWAVWV